MTTRCELSSVSAGNYLEAIELKPSCNLDTPNLVLGWCASASSEPCCHDAGQDIPAEHSLGFLAQLIVRTPWQAVENNPTEAAFLAASSG